MTEAKSVDLDLLDSDPRTNPNEMSEERFQLLKVSMATQLKDGKTVRQPLLIRPRDADLTSTPAPGRFYVVDGEHRKRALKELGVTSTSCVVEDMDDNEALVARIAMNRLRGELDMGVVATQLTELRDAGWNVDQLTLAGFNQDETTELLAAAAPLDDDVLNEPIVSPPTQVPEPSEKPFILELRYATRQELAAVKRKLRKAAGKGGDLAKALARVLEGA